jgi:uncharacterized membrane protein
VLLALTCLTLLLGFAEKSPCTDGNWGSAGMQYTHACYSDVVPLWGVERLSVGSVPYRDTAIEYPVLTGGFMWLTAELTRGLTALDSSWSTYVVFDVLTSILLAICALLITYFTAQSSGRRPYSAAIFALSPLLVFHAFTNWDLLAMALTSAALWCWSRRDPVLFGVLIGLGTAAKLYPVFILVGVLALAIRSRRWVPALWSFGAAAASWCAVNVPIAIAYHRGWWEFYSFSIDRATERSTIWAILYTMLHREPGQQGWGLTYLFNTGDASYWVPPGTAVAFALLAGLLLVLWAGLRAPATPRLDQLAFLAVLAFLLTTKVWSPQYSLWRVPLLALARPRWRLNLLWQFSEVAVWIMTLWVLLNTGGTADHLPYGFLVLVIAVRDLLLLAIAALIVRDMWYPAVDVADGRPSYFGLPDVAYEPEQ